MGITIDEIYPTKITHTIGFFSPFFGAGSILQLFYLYSSVAQLFTSLCPKIHLIWSKSD